MSQNDYEPIELEWLKVMKINTDIKSYEEEDLFDVYQQRILEIDQEEFFKWNEVCRKFGELTQIECQIFKRIYDEKRSNIELAYEGLIKTFGLDEDQQWYDVTCEYD